MRARRRASSKCHAPGSTLASSATRCRTFASAASSASFLPNCATGHSPRIASRADTASVYKKGGRWWLRFKGADGRWRGAPAKATTKPAARLEALERERLAQQQREGLAPSDDNRRRTFGELMNLWHDRYGSRLRSQAINLSVEKHLRPALGKLRLGGAAAALPALLNSKVGELSPSTLNHLRAYCHRL